MTLQEHFERSGHWLFRWRSYLPLVGLPVVFLALRQYRYPGNSEALHYLWEMVCLAVSFAGLGIRAYTIGHAPKGTSGRNTKRQVADRLNTTGAYSFVRNPLYLGNFFMGLGLVLFVHLWWFTLIYVLAFWLYYERIIFAEEAYLRKKFGTEYLKWAERTPVIIPSFRNYRRPELPFSFKNVLRREYNGFFAVIACFFLLETLSELVVKGRLEFDSGWIVALVVGFLVWVTLRTLKKRTSVLNVDGR